MKRLYYVGLVYAIGSAFVMSISAIATRKLGTSVSIYQLMFFRFIISCLYLTIFVRDYKNLFISKHWKLHLLRDAMGICSMFMVYTAYQHANVSNATALFFTTPFFVPLFLYFFRGVPIMHKLYVGIAIAFVGVLLVLHLGTSHLDWHLILALASGIIAAPAIVTIRTLTQHHEPPIRILAYYFSISLVVTGLFWVFSGAEIPAGKSTWILMTIVALAVTLYQQFLTIATKYCPARLIAPFQYSAVIFSAILEFFIWGEIPRWSSVLGIVLIVIGAVYIAYVFHIDSKKQPH